MDVRERRTREIKSPDRAKIYRQNQAVAKPMTKSVQVVYYLTRNGQLEHPHFMEVPLLANQPLRLRDVLKRLAALRGNGMPAMYSWSCKRGYKNGYVWNDLVENDAIYPSDGAEFVLKGSELVRASSGNHEDKSQELQMRKNRAALYIQEQNSNHALCSKPKWRSEPEKTTPSYGDGDSVEEEEEGEGEDLCEIDEEKTSYTSSTTPPHSRCSRGVSTGELELSDERKTSHTNTNQPESTRNSNESTRNPSNESNQHESTVPALYHSKASNRYDPNDSTRNRSNVSARHHSTASNRYDSKELTRTESNESTGPQRIEDGDPVVSESGPGRGSVLLQLISCGNMNIPAAKAKNIVNPKKNSGGNLHRGVLCKNLIENVVVVGEEEEDEEDDDKEMIKFMSENPRFGNLQAEEKEFFSGSIVESVSQDRVAAEPMLKKSNSYKEQRKEKGNIEEEKAEEKKEKGRSGKCIPRRKNTTSCFA